MSEEVLDDFAIVRKGVDGWKEALLRIIGDFSNAQLDLVKRATFLETIPKKLGSPDIVKAFQSSIQHVRQLKDMRVRNGFFKAFKCAFYGLPEAERMDCMVFHLSTFKFEAFSDIDPDFDTSLTACLSSVAQGSTDVVCTVDLPEVANNVTFDGQLSWFFMMNAKTTIMRVLKYMTESQASYEASAERIVEAFIHLKPVMQMKVSSDPDCDLITGGLKRLMEMSISSKSEDWLIEDLSNFCFFLIQHDVLNAALFLSRAILPGISQSRSIEWAIDTLRIFNGVLGQRSLSKNVLWRVPCNDSNAVNGKDALNPFVILQSVAHWYCLATLENTFLTTNANYAFDLQNYAFLAIKAVAGKLQEMKFHCSAVSPKQWLKADSNSAVIKLFICYSLGSVALGPMEYTAPNCLAKLLKLNIFNSATVLFHELPCDGHITPTEILYCTLDTLVQCCCLSCEFVEFLLPQNSLKELCSVQGSDNVVMILKEVLQKILPYRCKDSWHFVEQWIESIKLSGLDKSFLHMLSATNPHVMGAFSTPTFCNLCNCVISGPKAWEIHEAGRTHLDRLFEGMWLSKYGLTAAVSTTANASSFRCEACDKTMDAQQTEQWKKHLEGKDHQKKMRALAEYRLTCEATIKRLKEQGKPERDPQLLAISTQLASISSILIFLEKCRSELQN